MRIRVAAGALLAIFGLLSGPAAAPAQSGPTPVVFAKAPSKKKKSTKRSAKPKAGAKPTSKAGAKHSSKSSGKSSKGSSKKSSGKVASRKKGDPAEPDEAVRRAIAGLNAQKHVRESPELSAMRQVDLALFKPSTPTAGEPWPVEGSPVIDTNEPKVLATGLPPEGQLSAISAPPPEKDLSWLKKLDMPDIPVRWDARVIKYLEFYKNDPRGRSMATIFMRKSGRYGGAIRRVLREQGIPEDILWLSLVESGFEPTIHSPVGAAGLWQFMPEGARIYGLYVDRWVDERHDPERSTLAAARYLSDLKTRFGTWELAFAAYNMGYGGLLAAIKKYNTNDFWELSKLEAGVPFETALYVPKIIAIAIVARNKAVFHVDHVELDAAVGFDKISVESGVSLKSIASAAGVSEDAIEALNPQILAGRTPPLAPGLTVDMKWTVRVPVGAGQSSSVSLPKLIAAEPKLARYTVRFGEDIDDIASSLGTSKGSLRQLNGLRWGEPLRPGTVIFVPANAKGSLASATPQQKPTVVVPAQAFVAPGKRRVFYRVVSGDTLPEVAAVLRARPEDLAKWNLLDPGAKLHDGMMLQAYVGEKQVLAGVVVLEERDTKILSVGSDEFFAHFESQKGRERVFVTVKQGDTWRTLSKRHGLSLGMLERINQRSRSSSLIAGEKVVVYVPAGRAPEPSDKDEKPDVEVASATPEPSPDTKDDGPEDAHEGVKKAEDKPAEKAADKPSDKPSQATTAPADKEPEKVADKGPEKAADKPSAKPPEKVADRAPQKVADKAKASEGPSPAPRPN